jgi:hypothetical protein
MSARKQRAKVFASPYLTAGYEPELAAMMRATRSGQAHWSGSGPPGKTCGQCTYLGSRANCCDKFRQLTGERGAAIPPATRSCRHFQEKAR